MIFTSRTIRVKQGKSSIDEPIILYRGDFEVEVRFTILETNYRFKSGVNLIDSEKASHAQLALLAPDGMNVITEIGRCEDGTAIFTLNKDMIDELSEVGLYSFQIRLFDYYRESRITIPPIEFGIEVREPIASEDHINTIDQAMVGYSIAKTSVLDEPVPETFDADGQYNRTDWVTGDRVSEGKLNKIEDAIDKINKNAISNREALNKQMISNFNVLQSEIDNKVVETGELTLGINADGLLYIFKDGKPQGLGIEMSGQEVSGDVVGYIGDNNEIILIGSLPDGNYTMRYQYEDGTLSKAIDVTVGAVEVYKNLIPEAQEEGLTGVYNGVGYKEKLRWSGTNQAFVTDATKCVLTGLIPVGIVGDVFHIRGVDIVGYVDGRQSGWAHFYDAKGNRLQMAVNIPATVIGTDTHGDFTITLDRTVMTKMPINAVYVRFQFGQVTSEFIVSRNFLIP